MPCTPGSLLCLTGVGYFTALNIAGKTVELIPGGSRKRVTYEKLPEYCELYDQFRLHEFDDVVSYMQIGLGSIIPLKPLRLFTAQEVEELIIGKAEPDIALWKEKTNYRGAWGSGHTPSEKGKMFWRVIESLTNEQVSQFIMFGWGRTRLPDRNSTEKWKMSLQPCSSAHNKDSYLPIAHTCFFTLEMPQYSSDDVMRTRLLTALTYGSDSLQLK